MLGYVRERVFAHYFGNGAAADAFRAALRIPNALRNLLGEGTLSASFIPVYAGLNERNKDAARVLAVTILGLLLLASGVLTVIGVGAAPAITAIVAQGFDGPRRDLTTRFWRRSGIRIVRRPKANLIASLLVLIILASCASLVRYNYDDRKILPSSVPSALPSRSFTASPAPGATGASPTATSPPPTTPRPSTTNSPTCSSTRSARSSAERSLT